MLTRYTFTIIRSQISIGGCSLKAFGHVDKLGSFLPCMFAVGTKVDGVAYKASMNALKNFVRTKVEGEEFWSVTVGICDRADAIINAFNEVFKDTIKCVVICWFHVTKAIKENRSKFKNPHNYTVFMGDVRAIHECATMERAKELIQQLQEKLQQAGETVVEEWFWREWLNEKYLGWLCAKYAGFLKRVNNGCVIFGCFLHPMSLLPCAFPFNFFLCFFFFFG